MTPVVLPKMGLTMEDAKVVKWHKKEGEPVRIGEALRNRDGKDKC
jgi:pyruvate/2-oxoglutarate dehydrogenase complex dihydrolipoamide acyltransferase (E2) component